MDTPDRNSVGSSNFEDSPVFSYINNLSPIQPVKSIHATQSFNSFNFSSPPSVLTPPHVSSQRESKFLKRNFVSGSLKFDLSSNDGLKQNANETVLGAVQMPDFPADLSESFDGGCSIRDDIVDPKDENLELAIELPHTLKYECDSPECNTDYFQGIKKDTMLVGPGNPVMLVQSEEDVSSERRLFYQSGVDSHEICQVKQTKDVAGFDGQNLLNDKSHFPPSDLSKNTTMEDWYKMDLKSCFLNSLALSHGNLKDMLISQPLDQSVSFEYGADDSAAELMVREPNENNCEPDVLSGNFQNDQATFPSQIVDNKAGGHFLVDGKIDFQQQRGIRRRCLVFGASGAEKRELEYDSISRSLPSSQLNGKLTSYNTQLAPIISCSSSSPYMMPAIGLHLNDIAATTNDLPLVQHRTLAPGKKFISMPNLLSSLHSLSSEHKPLRNSLGLSSLTKYIDPVGNSIQDEFDASRASAFQVAEDFNENNPKRKRHRLELGGESEICKRCNCKKSKCLKLYCECFAAGVYFVEICSCQECYNKPIHEDIVLATRKQIESRNPLAFAPRVIRSSVSVPDIGEESNKTPASARHKRGCNCKKSNCLKKYCECYQGGVGCSINCRCEGCKNAFGSKDGSTTVGFGENGSAKEETEARETNSLDNSSLSQAVWKDNEQCPELLLPLNFSFQICRTAIQLPFSSISQPPKSTIPQENFEKHFQIMPEDETPDILRGGNMSPISGIKIASPSSKRVSPPHRESAFSPGKRNKRKLVLQSMPSFPSFTQNGIGDLF